MRVIEIILPKSYMRRKHEKRCSMKVRSCGTNYFNKDIGRCGRLAKFAIDGVGFCTQHAGAVALNYVINKQGNKI